MRVLLRHAVAEPLRHDPLRALPHGAAGMLRVPVLHESFRIRTPEAEIDGLAPFGNDVHAGVGKGRAAAVGRGAVHEHRRKSAA